MPAHSVSSSKATGLLEIDIVLPCGGGINLAIHRLQSVKELEEVIGELELRRETALRYSPASSITTLTGRYRICGSCSTAGPFISELWEVCAHGRRIKALADDGYSEADIDRIKAPIGIFGKAKSASSLALSIVADVVAARMSAKS